MCLSCDLVEWPYPTIPEEWAPYDADKDYCGPEGEWYSKYLSRYILGVDCNRCYYAHDQRYTQGTTMKDKVYADKKMWADQKKAICSKYQWGNPLRYLALAIALRRYHAVCSFGKEAFNAKG